MTKFILLSLSAFSLAGFAQSSFNFTINGTLKNAGENTYTYFHHKWNNKDITDSAKVKAGKFTLSGKGTEPNMYWMTKSRNMNEQPNLILEEDKKLNHIQSL